MGKSIQLLPLLLFPMFSLAQTNDPRVVASSGNHHVGSNGEMSWTIGEPLVMTFTSANDMLTQGYQQPLMPTNILITEVEDPSHLIATAYPNPTTDNLMLQMSEPVENVQVEVFSLSGTQQGQWNFSNSSSMNLDLSGLPSGNYIVRLTTGQTTSTINIQRIN